MAAAPNGKAKQPVVSVKEWPKAAAAAVAKKPEANKPEPPAKKQAVVVEPPKQQQQQQQKPAEKKKDEKKVLAVKEEKKTSTTNDADKPRPQSSRELDNRTLFLKNLPGDATEEEIRALSSDIENVRMKDAKGSKKKSNKKQKFAFIEFASEPVTEKNYVKLKQEAKLRGKPLFVDYVGEKSSYIQKKQEKKQEERQKRERDPKRIHIGGFDKSTKEADLKKLLAAGGVLLDFAMPLKKDKASPDKLVNMGFAFAAFASETDAKKALDAVNGKQINGRTIKADYAFVRPDANEKKDSKVFPILELLSH